MIMPEHKDTFLGIGGGDSVRNLGRASHFCGLVTGKRCPRLSWSIFEDYTGTDEQEMEEDSAYRMLVFEEGLCAMICISLVPSGFGSARHTYGE